LGGYREASCFRNRNEIAKMPEFHLPAHTYQVWLPSYKVFVDGNNRSDNLSVE
jgi:hypothetical protein